MRRLIAVLLVLMMAQASATASLAEAGEIENYTRYTDYTLSPTALKPAKWMTASILFPANTACSALLSAQLI